jgi:hypothetical protein
MADKTKLLKESLKASKDLNLSEEARLKIEERILDGKIKTTAEVKKQANDLVIIDARYRKIENTISKIQTRREKTKQVEDDLVNLQSELVGKAKENLKTLNLIGSSNEKNLDSSKKVVKEKQKELNALKASGLASKKQIQSAQNLIDDMQGQIDAIDTINQKAPLLAEALGEAGDMASEVQGKIDGFFANIPGGEILKKSLGLDQVEKQLSGGINAGIQAIGQGLKAGMTPMQALNAGMKAFNLTVLLNPVVLIVAAIVAAIVVLKKLVSLAGEHEKKARELAEAQGISVSQGKEMLKDAQSAASAFGVQLVNAKEVLSVQSELAEQLGNSSMISADVAANVAETGKAFGYGVKAAGELQATFQSIGLSAQDAADAQAELAQEALAAGVNTGKVVSDIAKNAKSTAKFFGGNVKALQKAAIEANKLGMSIADMAKISEGLLDFENSIAKQFEFQALSGKEINLDLARQKALQGDIAGATKEVLKQVGGIDEFNSMGVLQRQALADAAGMEVDQLQKTLAIQKAIPGATAEQLKVMEKLGLTAEQIQKMNPEDLKNKLAQEQAAEKMNTEMANMKAQLMQALLPLGEAFMKIFQVLSPILKVISFIFKGIGFAIELILSPLEAVYSIFESIEKAVGNIFGGFMDILSGDFESGFKKIGQGLLGIILMPFQAIVDLAVGFVNLLIDGVNMIPGVDLDYIPSPDLAGLVGGLIGLEQGGTVTSGGAFMVGESGPEVVNLSPGDAVTPNNQISNGGGSSSNIELIAVMKQMLVALQNPIPVQVGGNAIREIGAQIDIQRSYTSRG